MAALLCGLPAALLRSVVVASQTGPAFPLSLVSSPTVSLLNLHHHPGLLLLLAHHFLAPGSTGGQSMAGRTRRRVDVDSREKRWRLSKEISLPGPW